MLLRYGRVVDWVARWFQYQSGFQCGGETFWAWLFWLLRALGFILLCFVVVCMMCTIRGISTRLIFKQASLMTYSTVSGSIAAFATSTIETKPGPVIGRLVAFGLFASVSTYLPYVIKMVGHHCPWILGEIVRRVWSVPARFGMIAAATFFLVCAFARVGSSTGMIVFNNSTNCSFWGEGYGMLDAVVFGSDLVAWGMLLVVGCLPLQFRFGGQD